MPELRRSHKVIISELIDLALSATAQHKDTHCYVNHAAIVRKELGMQVADEFTPQDLEKWLNDLRMRTHGKIRGTKNRARFQTALRTSTGLS